MHQTVDLLSLKCANTCMCAKFLATKLLTISQLSFSENAFKLTNGNAEFFWEYPWIPLQGDGRGKEWKGTGEDSEVEAGNGRRGNAVSWLLEGIRKGQGGNSMGEVGG
jgi:hypothetical protein